MYKNFLSRRRAHRTSQWSAGRRQFGLQLRASGGMFYEQLEARALMAVLVEGNPIWLDQGQGPAVNGQVVIAPNNPVTGPIQSIAAHPTDADIAFVGTVNGGIWRTTNATNANPIWTPLTDQFASLAIGHIAYSPLDVTNQTLFAGTGQFDNGFTGGPAIGLMRTTDNGDTWVELDPTASDPLAGLRIRSVVPTGLGGTLATQVVLVATVDGGGVFRSVNGGLTFTPISGALGSGLPAGSATDLIPDPNNPSRFYAALPGQGVYRSDDQGVSWTPIVTGLAFAGSNNLELAAHDGGATTVLYAAVINGSVLSNVYRDAAGGDGVNNDADAQVDEPDETNWAAIGVAPAIHPGAQGFNNFSIVADRGNANLVYVGGDRQGAAPFVGNLFIGNAATGTWSSIVLGGANNSAPHADSRHMVFDANNNILQADDGGIYRLTNPSAGARVWTSANGNLRLAEYYSIGYDSVNNVLIGGTQDTGSSEQSAFGSPVWNQIRQGDGNTQAVDNISALPNTIRYTMGNNFNTFVRRTFNNANAQVGADVNLGLAGLDAADTGFTGFTIFPYVLNTIDPTRMLIGGSVNLYESTDQGDNLTIVTPAGQSGVTALAYGGRLGGVDNEEVAYVGFGNGNLYLRSVAGGAAAFNQLAAYPGGAPRDIALDSENWQRAYVADGSGVFFTPDGGATWQTLTGNLGGLASNFRSIDIVRAATAGSTDDVVLVGALGGVFRALNPSAGAATLWTDFSGVSAPNIMPNIIANDVQYNATDDRLLVGTHGRGAWRLDSASIVVGNPTVLTVCGDEDHVNQDDSIRLVRDAGNPLLLDVFINGLLSFTGPLAAFSQINVFGVGGNDDLIVESTNGLIDVINGIRYDGDGACPDDVDPGFGYDRGFDRLTLLQTGGPTRASDVYRVGPGIGSGISTISDPGSVQQVFFEELEPVIDLVPAASLTVFATSEHNAINYVPGLVNPINNGRVTIDNYEAIEFSNKTQLTINALEGDDIVNLNHAATPTGLTRITLNGNEGDDQLTSRSGVSVAVTMEAGVGNDLVDGSGLGAGPNTLNGGDGNDVINGSGGVDTIGGGTGDDLVRASDGDDTIDGGAGFDTILVQGTLGRDTIDIDQSSATALFHQVADELGNVTSSTDTLVTLAGVRTVEAVRIDAGQGNDTIRVAWADVLGTDATLNSLRFDVIGGPASTRDVLGVSDAGTGDLMLFRKGFSNDAGSITVGPGNAEPLELTFVEVEYVEPLPSAGGDIVVFKPDPFEFNNRRTLATYLGANGAINVDPLIDEPVSGFPADQDWYRVVAEETGVLDFQVYFRQVGPLVSGRPGLPNSGNLDIEVTDAAGNVVTGFGVNDALDDERIRIPAVAGRTYYLRVFANGAAINSYNVTVDNYPPPTPYALELLDNPAGDFPPANSDTGRSQFDNITRDNTPTVVFRIDDATFLNDLPGNSAAGSPPDELIPIPFQAAGGTPGYRVAIFDEGSSPAPGTQAGTPPQTPLGFATFVSAGVYQLTLPALSDGSHFLTARVQMVDPATPQQTGWGSRSTPIEVIVDTLAAPSYFGQIGLADTSQGLNVASDTGVITDPTTFADRVTSDTTPSFYGRAEADAVLRLYAETNGVAGLQSTGATPDLFLGLSVAEPLDGTNQFPGGQWSFTTPLDLNNPAIGFLVRDGARSIYLTSEDVAGNTTPDAAADTLNIFLDTRGPQVTNVEITSAPLFNLFGLKPDNALEGPTPPVNSLTVRVVDLPARSNLDPGFLYAALQSGVATALGNFVLRGDHSGFIPILGVTLIGDPPANGVTATARIRLDFAEPLPDDRFTLTISDNLLDPAGNHLDGESNAIEPIGGPFFPSGDLQPGHDFLARFTVDSRPEVGSISEGLVYVDINGNFVWDPEGKDRDASNRDFVFQFGQLVDAHFSGNFALAGAAVASGYDKLGAYGRFATKYSFILDTDDDGVGDFTSLMPVAYQVNGIPVAGEFNAAHPGDEIGLFDGSFWYLDTNGNNLIDVGERFASNFNGLPLVGDFNGDGSDDLAVFVNDTNRFIFDTNRNGIADFTWDVADDVERFVGLSGFTDRPVAGDLNLDGVDDIGLWVKDRSGTLPRDSGEYFFWVSDRLNANPANVFDAYSPDPLGNDLFAEFGDDFGLPIFGNFDPPVDNGLEIPNPLHRDLKPFDVNGDGFASPLDALLVINVLNTFPDLPVNNPVRTYFTIGELKVDTNGDRAISPLDALLIINELNRASSGNGEGEMPALSTSMPGEYQAAADDFFAQLASGGDWQFQKKRG